MKMIHVENLTIVLVIPRLSFQVDDIEPRFKRFHNHNLVYLVKARDFATREFEWIRNLIIEYYFLLLIRVLSLSRILALIFENVLEILSFQITNR